MPPTNFAGIGIGLTLKNFRQLISSFPRHAGSVSVISTYRSQSQIVQWMNCLPNVKPYYAVKCNPDPLLLQGLYNSGAGFDCASLREVYSINTLKRRESFEGGTDAIYAHPMKSERDICLVDSTGIRTTVVDSVEECEKLKKYGWRGSAFLRVVVKDSGSKMPFSSKFGATHKEVLEIAEKSKIPLSGVSFHVGSGCENPEQYKDAIQYAAGEVFDILRKFAHNPNTIDIGGGFSSDPREFKKTVKVIQDSIETYVPKNRRVIAEPGRYMAQPFQDLFVKIIAKKPLTGGGWRYVIDESLYGHFSCIPFDGQRPAWVHIPSEERIAFFNKKHESVLFGRTCDSLDVIAKGPMEEMHVGDWLYFPLMGAYTSATASEFNGFPKPTSIVDLEDLLPSTEEAWVLMDDIHEMRPLTYSNTLPPIT